MSFESILVHGGFHVSSGGLDPRGGFQACLILKLKKKAGTERGFMGTQGDSWGLRGDLWGLRGIPGD